VTDPNRRSQLHPDRAPAPPTRERAWWRVAGRAVALLGVVALGLAAGCGRGTPPQLPPPALEGQRVMILPVLAGSPPELDTEIGNRLPQRAPATDWLLPDELQAMLDRAPAWRVRLNALPRHIADAGGRAPRLVDPTYGSLRQLGAIADAMVALMPIMVRQEATAAGLVLELDVALVNVRGGQVLWIRTVRGEAADGSVRAAAAAAAETLATALFPG
jgi:hypothetical protein